MPKSKPVRSGDGHCERAAAALTYLLSNSSLDSEYHTRSKYRPCAGAASAFVKVEHDDVYNELCSRWQVWAGTASAFVKVQDMNMREFLTPLL
eukprot:1153447-Pelagomonas_calceolata.AAC.4